MGVENAVRAHLIADADVVAIASTRGYVLKFPQNVQAPAFRVTLISEPRTGHLRGGVNARMAQVQIDAIAEETSGTNPYARASALADAIDAALMSQAPFTESGVECKVVERLDRLALYDPEELRIVRIVQDYRVWSKAV